MEEFTLLFIALSSIALSDQNDENGGNGRQMASTQSQSLQLMNASFLGQYQDLLLNQSGRPQQNQNVGSSAGWYYMTRCSLHTTWPRRIGHVTPSAPCVFASKKQHPTCLQNAITQSQCGIRYLIISIFQTLPPCSL
jgi:hypothetical protein